MTAQRDSTGDFGTEKTREKERPKEIADKLGESALNVGHDLHNLKERGLADTEGEGQWRITDEGREWVEEERGGKGERKGNGKDHL